MWKKLRRIATTFIALGVGYAAYLRGFAVVASLIGAPGRVPLLPEKLELSTSGQQARELARLAFGPGHWTSNAVLQYYDTYRGFWIFARDYSFPDEDHGKKLVLKPFALIWRSGRSKALKTLTGETATLVFNQPPDMGRGGGGQTHVTWAEIRDNVQLRDDKGTPAELGDDLTIGPLGYLAFSEEKNTISSESPVVIREGDTIATSDAGVEIALLPRVTPEGVATQSYEGAKTITLHGHVAIHTQDVGETGLVPGGAQKPGQEGQPREPRPGEITCDNGLRVDLPPPQRTPRVGPPAPMGPTFAHFSKNVQVRQGNAQAPEQLNSDQLHLTLLPADKSARSVDAQVGGPVASLSLSKAHATGHAVWLQSKEQHAVAGPGTELVYQRRSPEGLDDTTYFRGLRGTEVRKENIDEKDPANSTVDIIHAYDITIYHRGRGASISSAIAGGPGWMESRSLATREVLRRAEWHQRLVLQPVEGDDSRRQITLDGRPRVLDPTQGEITASQQIVALLASRVKPEEGAPAAGPNAKAAASASTTVAKASTAGQSKEAKASNGPLGGGSYRLEMVRATRDVVLVTLESSDGEASEGAPGGGSKKTIRAAQSLIAHFDPPPEPPPGQAAAQAAPAPAQGTPALARADQPKAAAGSPEPQAGQTAQAQAKPPEPPIDVRAESIWARLGQKSADAKGSDIREVRLRGDVLVRQDPEPGKERGLEVEGDQVDLIGLGDGGLAQVGGVEAVQGGPDKGRAKQLYQVRTLGNPGKLARISTQDFELWGLSPFLDQSRNFARVDGPGKLIQYKAGGNILGDAMSGGMVPNLSRQGEEGRPADAVAKAEEKDKPEKDRGPLTISWGLDGDGRPLGPVEGEAVTSWMEFHGVTAGEGGAPGPAQALFYSNARFGVRAKTNDSEVGCVRMIAFLDAPVDFRRSMGRPQGESGDGKKPQARITRVVCEQDVLAVNVVKGPNGRLTDVRRVRAQSIDYEKATDVFTCEKDVEIVAMQFLEGGQVKEKQRVVGQEVIYKKATGDFYVNSEGDVDLYARAKPADGEGQMADGGRATLRPVSDGPAQAKARAKAGRPEALMPLELTQIHFNRSMNGQVAARREGSKRANGEAEFHGGVEMMKAVVSDENQRLDADRPPREYVRSVSRTLRVVSEPPATKGEADHILVRAFGNLYAKSAKPNGQISAIKADDQMVYDSAKGLSIIYGGPGGVTIVDQSGLGQKASYGAGEVVQFNHKTGQHMVQNPRTVQLLDPKGSLRAGTPPVEKEKPPEKKKRPMFPKVNQSDKERRNFTGR